MMRQVSSPVRRGTRGKGQKWTSPVCLPSDKRRKNEQAKDAERLGPKRHCSGNRGSSFPCHGHPTLPANREHLTRPCQPCGTWEARIAPFERKVGKSSGQPMAVRVGGWDKAKAVL